MILIIYFLPFGTSHFEQLNSLPLCCGNLTILLDQLSEAIVVLTGVAAPAVNSHDHQK